MEADAVAVATVVEVEATVAAEVDSSPPSFSAAVRRS